MSDEADRGALWRLIEWPAHRPVAAVVVAALVALASLLGVLRMTADTSLQGMFPRGDPAAAAMVRVMNHFSAADDLLILTTLPSRSSDDSAPLLAFADRLHEAARSSPRAAALVDAVVYRADEQTRSFFEKVLVPAGMYYLSDDAFEAAKKRLTRAEMVNQIRQNEAMISAPGPAAGALSGALLQDPLRLHEFILNELNARRPFKSAGNTDAFLSPNGRSLLIRVIGKKSLGDLEFAKQMTATVAALAKEANNTALELDIAGGYAIAAASERAIRRDMIVSVISSVVLLQALFIVAYRRPVRYFLLAFVPVAVGILFGFGLRSALSATISPAAAVVGAVLAGLGIDYTVLYLPQYYNDRATGNSAAFAAARTSRRLAGTLLAGCVTSLIGFAAIGWSSVSALRDFSLVGSLGLAGALLASLWLLPALLVLFDRGVSGPARGRVSLQSMLTLVARHRRAMMLGSCAVLLAGLGVIVFLPGQLLPLESDLTVMHPRPNPPLDAQAKIARRMGIGPDSMIVHLGAASAEQLVRTAVEVDRRLKGATPRAAGVSGSYGIGTLLPDPEMVERRRSAFSAAEVDRVVADLRVAIAESSFSEAAYEPYVAFLRRVLLSPAAPTLADLGAYQRLAETMLSRETVASAARGSVEAMTVVFMDRSLDDRASRVKAVDAVRGAIADVPGATVTGLGVVSLDTEQAIGRDLPRLMALACGLIAAYHLLHFRNLRAALLALVPVTFSLVCLFALLRLTGQRFNLVNLVALPLLIGIDVDYGIFLVGLAGISRRETGAVTPGGIASSAHSITVSAAANVLGFGSLITTSVPAIRSLGWTVGLGVTACYVGTMFLLVPIVLSRAAQADEMSRTDAAS